MRAAHGCTRAPPNFRSSILYTFRVEVRGPHARLINGLAIPGLSSFCRLTKKKKFFFISGIGFAIGISPIDIFWCFCFCFCLFVCLSISLGLFCCVLPVPRLSSFWFLFVCVNPCIFVEYLHKLLIMSWIAYCDVDMGYYIMLGRRFM